MLEPGFHGDHGMLRMFGALLDLHTSEKHPVRRGAEALLSAGENRAHFPDLTSPFSCHRDGEAGEMFLNVV